MPILTIILPIFTIALLGYLFAWSGFFKAEQISGIAKYVFNLAIPVLLFNAMSTIELPERIEWAFFLSYYGAVFFNFVLGSWIGRRFFRLDRPGQAMIGLGSAYSNMVLIGLPVIAAGLGDEALLPMFLLISVHSAILFTSATVMAESGGTKGQNWTRIVGQAVRKILRNPIIIGLFSGLIFNQLSFTLPEVLIDTIELIRGSALPCALFVMGASLSRYRLAGQFSRAAAIIIIKMGLMPLLVFFLARTVLDISPLWTAVAVIAAGLPVGVNVAVFAINYQAAVAPVTTAVLISTLLSIGSLTVLLTLLLPTI
ncbi:MAG: AEC family transporter [Ardenticatenaceae bacterium]|nr:AEC family transporter [Ardenticatenaceae bacterium]